jgi:hypothetical protein
VIHTHGSVSSEVEAIREFLDHNRVGLSCEDVYFSFLPLAHIFDRWAGRAEPGSPHGWRGWPPCIADLLLASSIQCTVVKSSLMALQHADVSGMYLRGQAAKTAHGMAMHAVALVADQAGCQDHLSCACFLSCHRVVEEAMFMLGASVGYFAGAPDSRVPHSCISAWHTACRSCRTVLWSTKHRNLRLFHTGYSLGAQSSRTSATSQHPTVLSKTLRADMMCCGCAGDTKKLLDDCAVLRPTVFVAVPRVYERVYSGVMDKVGA